MNIGKSTIGTSRTTRALRDVYFPPTPTTASWWRLPRESSGSVPIVKLTLVRHGQTSWNRQSRIQGWIDVGLTEPGRRKARDLADQLSVSAVDRLVSSPLRRARETADIICQNSSLGEVRTDACFRELDQGYWNGLRGDTVRRLDGERYRAWQRDPLENPPPGGETLSTLKARIRNGLSSLKNPEGTVHLVAHKVVNSMIMHLAGDRTLNSVLEDLPDNLAVRQIELNPSRFSS